MRRHVSELLGSTFFLLYYFLLYITVVIAADVAHCACRHCWCEQRLAGGGDVALFTPNKFCRELRNLIYQAEILSQTSKL